MNNKRELEFEGIQGKFLSQLAKPLIKYFEDEEIEDFQITNFKRATLVKRGGIKEFIEDDNLTKEFIETLMFFLTNISPQSYNYKKQQISMILPVKNKFRFTGKLDGNVKSGVEISIRLTHGLYEYKDFKLSQLEFNFLTKHICKNHCSVFIIGGTGAGKTSFNNMLIYEISDNVLIKVVGDIHDFVFKADHKVSELMAKNVKEYQEVFDLLMRINPDRILIPELTTENVSLILRAMNTGHGGFMLTLHSQDGELDVAKAFKKNMGLSGKAVDNLMEIQESIHDNIDFLVYLVKDDRGVRKVSKVTINNKKILEEAKELEIFGLHGENNKRLKKIKSKDKKKRKELTTKEVSNLLKDYIKGKSLRELESIYKINYVTIYRITKNIKREKNFK